MRFLLAALLPFLAAPAYAGLTTYICSGSIKVFYLDWDGSRYTVDRHTTITINADQNGNGYVTMDLGREPLTYQGPLYLDGTHEHALDTNESWGDHVYFITRMESNRVLTFSARITNRNNVMTSGVYPSAIECK